MALGSLGLTQRPSKKLPDSRQSAFALLDHPALRPLPTVPDEYAEWTKARVNIDYPSEVERPYDSVPYPLVHQHVDVRLTARCVECFVTGKRVSSHRRSSLPGQHTTLTAHMPEAPQQYAEWTPERLVRWAEQTGPATAHVITTMLAARAHPQQGFRSCLGSLRLGKTYGLVVLWRLRYKLSLRDLSEMFLERGFIFTHEAVRIWEATWFCCKFSPQGLSAMLLS